MILKSSNGSDVQKWNTAQDNNYTLCLAPEIMNISSLLTTNILNN